MLLDLAFASTISLYSFRGQYFVKYLEFLTELKEKISTVLTYQKSLIDVYFLLLLYAIRKPIRLLNLLYKFYINFTSHALLKIWLQLEIWTKVLTPFYRAEQRVLDPGHVSANVMHQSSNVICFASTEHLKRNSIPLLGFSSPVG